ncbi:DUF4360 domain-containing protein [Streptomyces antimicrobicus]|uniref:DUF4360 domain-containing protein n=1 Tax=Streptomyces antimicrobicus TaxID=2883108 RepID=A0ABS8BAS4_9ACTN|nr:DUF4360 domain-containing protein [Streptomyces antimicrobicus]MCB5181730.1 DUF4360 domain-containing protein [Streptomyces antimicrobicus]
MLKPVILGGAAAMLLVTAAAPPAGADDLAPTGKITVDVATVNGSGCRPGSAAVAVAPDNTAFTVTYSEYLARAGGDSTAVEGRKNCQLSLVVNVPQGYTYAIAQVDYRGFGSLQPGAVGTQKASYYFQGMSQTAARSHRFQGALDDNWQVTDTADIHALVFAPCGEKRNFNINTELRAEVGTSDPTRTSYMALDSTDGSINSKYHFAWKKCEAPA